MKLMLQYSFNISISNCIDTANSSFDTKNQRFSVKSNGYEIIHSAKLIVGNVNKYSKSILRIHEFCYIGRRY